MKYKNNWIPTKTIEEMSETDYDVLIIGSGPGGGAALYRLCELRKNQGAKKIGILEMGDKLFHSHALNIPTQNVNTARDQLLPDNSTPVGERLPQFSGATMVYALGGRTGHVSIIGIGTIGRREFSDKLGNLSILKFETNESPYQIQILGPDQYFSYQQFEDKQLKDNLMVVYAAFGTVEPRAENRVYVDPSITDDFGVPLSQVQYSLSNKDRQTANQVAQGIRETASAMGVTLDESSIVLRPPGADMHESCTS